MRPRSVGGQVLSARRRGMAGWSVGIAALAGLTAAFWPAVAQDPAQLEQLMRSMPDAMLAFFGAAVEDLVSPAGYLDTQLFALPTPLLFLLFAVGGITRALADEERDGRLEVLLANPVSRRRVVLEKGAAVGALVVALGVVHLATVAVVARVVVLEVGLGSLVAMHLSLLLLTGCFGALALAVAGSSGRRGLAIGVTTAVAAGTYLLDSFGAIVDWLEPVRPMSPFYLYRAAWPLHQGLDPLHAGVLAGVTAVLVVVAIWGFERRDVGSG